MPKPKKLTKREKERREREKKAERKASRELDVYPRPRKPSMSIDEFETSMTVLQSISGRPLTFAHETAADSLFSQSKLSQDELQQLMKSTHFDKKELQQWYKGRSPGFNSRIFRS
ncbi:MAG: hypothetical protein LQ352_005201 [Teloschistes flavicans]|nr:MAG: hypothetical protein LQ352_005201 [Teloschistes flavicans]